MRKPVFSFFFLLCYINRGLGIPSDFFSFSPGHHGRPSSENDDDGSYYKVLGHGVSKLSNPDEIKKAYRKKAMQLHPDKGGDAEDFKSLTEAYEILSDAQKRAMYDKFGVAGLSDTGRGSRSSASEMAREFFKGFGAFSVPLVFQLDLSLEDFYVGKEITIPLDSTQQVKVVVEPGMYGGQELVAKAEYRGMPRDVILRLREIQHPVFLRRNSDLLVDVSIDLSESLLGFRRTIRLLDGKDVVVVSPAEEVFATESVFVIPNLGMPVYRAQQEVRGRLFVRSRLEMPKSLSNLSSREISDLKRLLHKIDGKKEGPDSVTTKGKDKVKDERLDSVDLTTADIRSFGQFGGGPEDDDDDFQRSPFSQYFFR